MLVKNFCCFLLLVSCANGSKILGLVATMSRSHHIVFSALLQELAARGHEVTVYSPFTDKNVPKNYKQIYVEGTEEIAEMVKNFVHPNNSLLTTLIHSGPAFFNVTNKFWESKAVQELIKTRPKYDLVISMSFFSDSITAFGWYLKAPVIVFFPSGSNSASNKYVGNPNPPYVSTFISDYPATSFINRLFAYTFMMVMKLIDKVKLSSMQNDIVQKHLPGAPPLEDLLENVALVFVNAHYSIETPRPYVPNIIQVGGLHSKDPKPLPKALKDFLDGAAQGAVLLTFGSNMKIANVDPDKLNVILEGLANIAPMKVLLKSEIPLPRAAKNIKVMNWVPQNDVLGHPNIKAFISHGGLGGTTESVFHGVPMLGIPFFADQHMNLKISEKAGYAVFLKYEDINKENFGKALNDILNNKSYSNNAKFRSELLRNQPVKPMDKAIFWVEHIIKHKGGKHLRNEGMDLTWYEYYLLDLILFYVVVLSMLLYFILLMLKASFNLLKKIFFKNETKKQKKL